MTKTIVLLLVAGLAAAAAIWWIRVDAQPVTVDEIGDENQTVARGQLPRSVGEFPGRIYSPCCGLMSRLVSVI